MNKIWEVYKTACGCAMLIPILIAVYYVLKWLWSRFNYFTEIEAWVCLPFGRYKRISSRAAAWVEEYVESLRKHPTWHNRYRCFVAELMLRQYNKTKNSDEKS